MEYDFPMSPAYADAMITAMIGLAELKPKFDVLAPAEFARILNEQEKVLEFALAEQDHQTAVRVQKMMKNFRRLLKSRGFMYLRSEGTHEYTVWQPIQEGEQANG